MACTFKERDQPYTKSCLIGMSTDVSRYSNISEKVDCEIIACKYINEATPLGKT